ncbi:zinc finger CCCH domain-containing protein 23-like [Typha angustifolia]|uniref:zinc finger CCCH domain-containing protein 23-like n=1 Tax=Typha angustifolia TaxID=59011 RepID=UPI003C2AE619
MLYIRPAPLEATRSKAMVYGDANHLDPTAMMDYYALHCFLPSNSEADSASSDEFRMYEFKVRRCPRGRPHDWTACAYAHPGEKAARRDPRRIRYAGTPCADFRRRGACGRGDACELAHGVFESWLHPDRYRTQPCKDGVACRRRVCFFAHTCGELRAAPMSPTSTLAAPVSPMAESPPLSPVVGMREMVEGMRRLRLGKTRSMPWSWRYQMGLGLGSPTPTRVAAAEEMEVGQRREEESISGDEMDFGWISDLVQ